MMLSVQVPLTARVAGATGQVLPVIANGALVATELMEAGLPPELVMVTGICADVALSAVTGKLTTDGLKESAPGATPVPDSDAVAAGLPVYGTERVPVRWPVIVGVKVMESVQCCEAGKVAGHVLVTA